MRKSRMKSTLAVLRTTIGLTQQQMADLVGCSKPTIQAIELGKLTLSKRLAEQISLMTGIDPGWLQGGKYREPPTSDLQSTEIYSKATFDNRQADLARPRSGPIDLVFMEHIVVDSFARIADIMLEAHDTRKNILYYYKLRMSIETLENEFGTKHKIAKSANREGLDVSIQASLVIQSLRNFLKRETDTKNV